jgi:hypothetical protein
LAATPKQPLKSCTATCNATVLVEEAGNSLSRKTSGITHSLTKSLQVDHKISNKSFYYLTLATASQQHCKNLAATCENCLSANRASEQSRSKLANKASEQPGNNNLANKASEDPWHQKRYSNFGEFRWNLSRNYGWKGAR